MLFNAECDGVVGHGMHGLYIGDIVASFLWKNENETEWLTFYGKSRCRNIAKRHLGEAVCKQNKCFKLQVKALLLPNSLIHLEPIAAEHLTNYVMSLYHIQNGGYLSKLVSGNKCSALLYLYCTHNKLVFPQSFCLHFGNLYCGVFDNFSNKW